MTARPEPRVAGPRPTLLNSCAWAATAAEARFRIDAAPRPHRETRVVALDGPATAVIDRVATQSWPGTRFLCCPDDVRADQADIVLRDRDARPVWLSEELIDADFVMMVATEDDGAAAASVIGQACTQRGITTAGLAVGSRTGTAAAVAALRPHARVLLVTDDEADVDEMLMAVGL